MYFDEKLHGKATYKYSKNRQQLKTEKVFTFTANRTHKHIEDIFLLFCCYLSTTHQVTITKTKYLLTITVYP